MAAPRGGGDPTLRLLKSLLAGEREALAGGVLARQVDFAQLAAILEREHLALYVQVLLESQRLLKLFPASFRERLQRQTEQQRQRQAEVLRAMGRLQSTLLDRGIPSMVLKGLPLADRYWGGSERRFVWDLDLLVRESDRQAAMDTLLQDGFSLPPWLNRASPIVFRLMHAIEFTAPAVAVDLHWCFRRRPGIRIDYREVWRDARSWRLDGQEYLVPGDSDTLMIMLLGLAHDAERGHISLRKIWDVYLWLRAESDFRWPDFFAACDRRGVETLCLNMLHFSLLALECTEEFPALVAWLEAHPAQPCCDSERARRMLDRPSRHRGNRLWIARQQSVSTWYYLLWWTVTSPMRYFFGRSL